MDENLDLSSLTQQQVDADTFRRVWARVMPDQTNSPIVVEPAKTPSRKNVRPVQGQGMPTQGRGSAAPPAHPQPQPEPAASGKSTGERLRNLMDLAQEGAAAGQLLAWRVGGQGKTLVSLAADRRQALRRLSAAYFLETGRRYRPKDRTPALNGTLAVILRGQFLWEQRWGQACRQAAAELTDQSLRELCQELAQGAQLRGRVIRTALERM